MGHEAVGQVLLQPRVGAESELEDAHSRQAELIAKRFDGGRDHAQVFGDHGSWPSRRRSASKNSLPGAGTHLPDAAVGDPAGISQ